MNLSIDKEKIVSSARDWLKSPMVPRELKTPVETLLAQENLPELSEAFYKDLEFGTGGLRGIMGPGTNRLNTYTVMKASYALGSTLIGQWIPKLKLEEKSKEFVYISYDTRKDSQFFAKVAAEVLTALNLKVRLFAKPTPVGICSYMIQNFKGLAGIMITASHNPKEYNGVKVYDPEGAQVTPPRDTEVMSSYKNITPETPIERLSFDSALAQKMVEYIPDNLIEDYQNHVLSLLLNSEMCQNSAQKLKVVYSPLHGTGIYAIKDMVQKLGPFDLKLVSSQNVEDSSFPTVPSPNPENPEALKEAINLMLDTNSHLAFATDPDSDRIGVVLNINGKPHTLNGNELANLVVYYLCSQKKLEGSETIIKSIVTSNLQNKIAQHFGVSVIETLTGFKWMAQVIQQHNDKGSPLNFLFASEESFGLLNTDKIRDKDAVSALASVLEMTLYYQLKGMNLLQVLDEIYTQFGVHREDLLSFNFEGLNGQVVINKIMEHFRSLKETFYYGEKKIESMTDYSEQTIQRSPTDQKPFKDLPSSNVLKIVFSDSTLFLRPSGTEPKIKFYLMAHGEQNSSTLEEQNLQVSAILGQLTKNINNDVARLKKSGDD